MEKVIVAVVTALFCAIFGSKTEENTSKPEDVKAEVSNFEGQILKIDRPAIVDVSRY